MTLDSRKTGPFARLLLRPALFGILGRLTPGTYKALRIRPYIVDIPCPTILDLGCGDGSPQVFAAAFPTSSYIGVDHDGDRDPRADSAETARFISADLETTTLDEVADASVDLVVATHVLEHLKRGCNLIDTVARKLRPGGFLFVIYPTPDSVHFPSMRGTLNFYDHPEHVTVVTPEELVAHVRSAGLSILSEGVSRNPVAIAIMPARVILTAPFGALSASAFWDIYGFERYLIAKFRG